MISALADDRQNGPDDLDARIARAKAEHSTGVTSAEAASKAARLGDQDRVRRRRPRLGRDRLGIDNYAGLGTKPWAMVGMLVLGFVGGRLSAR